MRAFEQFCREFRVPSFPATGENLVLFATWCTLIRNYAVGTTRNYLAAVRQEHLRWGVELPTPSTYFPLGGVVRGSQRFLQRPTRKKEPMSLPLLARLLAGTHWGSPWRVLYLLLFTSFLRLASVVPKGGRRGFNPALHLTWGRVTWKRGSVSIRITQTKTLQFNENFLEFAIPEHENKSVCLYTHLKAWFETTPRPSQEDPVFVCLLAGGRVVPVTRHLATKVFKAGLEMSGVDNRGFGWSSFRRGGATSYFLASGNVEKLRSQGAWKSQAYREYLCLPGSARGDVATTLLDLL